MRLFAKWFPFAKDLEKSVRAAKRRSYPADGSLETGDFVQTSLLKILESDYAEKLRTDPECLRAFANKVAGEVVFDAVRARRRRKRHGEKVPWDEEYVSIVDQAEAEDRAFLSVSTALKRFVMGEELGESLPAERRDRIIQVFHLKAAGHSHRAIAAALKIGEARVQDDVYILRKLLKDAM